MKKFLGEKFGRLTVVDREKDRAVCRCDCGATHSVRMDKLREGKIKSCGCWRREANQRRTEDGVARREAARTAARESALFRRAARAAISSSPENQAKRKLRGIHSTMLQRCGNPNYRGYAEYGSRGRTVCDEWLKFEPFYEWAKSRYKPGLWIERVDNEKGYSPDNCTFASPKQQGRNRSNTLWVTDGVEQRPLSLVTERLGINYARGYKLHRRLVAAGENPPQLRHFLAIANKNPNAPP